jgi:DNA-directed RNA polymerase subunit N (RpoN/RPB10)
MVDAVPAYGSFRPKEMMPVPSHLIGSVRPKDPTLDEAALDAEVVCACGSMRFQLLFPGLTHVVDDEQVPCVAEFNRRFFFLIKARCTSCGREHLLIDQDFHGWNGFVCHDRAQAAIPRPTLVPWNCLACGKTEHEAEVQIQTEGRRDLIANSNGQISEDRWPDAFGWFSMSIRCTACGKHTNQWVSLETM